MLWVAQTLALAGPILGWLAFLFSWEWLQMRFVPIFLLSFVAYVYYVWLFQCPQCEQSFNYRERTDLGKLYHDRCCHCGLRRGDTTFRDRLVS